MNQYSLSHLQELEAESIYVIRVSLSTIQGTERNSHAKKIKG